MTTLSRADRRASVQRLQHVLSSLRPGGSVADDGRARAPALAQPAGGGGTANYALAAKFQPGRVEQMIYSTAVNLELYPIVTLQYSSTTSYQGS
jgi:hypothetical protein